MLSCVAVSSKFHALARTVIKWQNFRKHRALALQKWPVLTCISRYVWHFFLKEFEPCKLNSLRSGQHNIVIKILLVLASLDDFGCFLSVQWTSKFLLWFVDFLVRKTRKSRLWVGTCSDWLKICVCCLHFKFAWIVYLCRTCRLVDW